MCARCAAGGNGGNPHAEFEFCRATVPSSVPNPRDAVTRNVAGADTARLSLVPRRSPTSATTPSPPGSGETANTGAPPALATVSHAHSTRATGAFALATRSSGSMGPPNAAAAPPNAASAPLTNASARHARSRPATSPTTTTHPSSPSNTAAHVGVSSRRAVFDAAGVEGRSSAATAVCVLRS